MRRRNRHLQLEPLEIRRVLAQDLNLLADLNTASVNTSLNPAGPITHAGGIALFSATVGASGNSLWKSDGTWGGTQLVEENVTPQNITAVGTTTFFIGTHGGHHQLWKSDGTAAGTRLASTIAPTLGSLTNVGGTLYFTGTSPTGTGLFKFDAATSTATLLLASPLNSRPQWLTNVSGTLFFNALKPGSTGERGLWKSDGTPGGTVRVDNSQANFDPQQLANFGGTLLFSAFEIEGRELWKSDGTAVGTVLVKNVDPGNPTPQDPGDPSSDPQQITVVGAQLYFTASTKELGEELWVTDGTTDGTHVVQDIQLGDDSSFPEGLTNVAGTLFFTAHEGVWARKLWRTDGTSAGTVSFNVEAKSKSLTNLNGILLFDGDTQQHGTELWRSDGTPGGTSRVKDIRLGSTGSVPSLLANVAGQLFFSADDGVHGRELWKSDGTAAGTKLVKDLPAGTADSDAADFTSTGQWTFFTANFNSPPEGEIPSGELWRSDGTAAGTTKFLDIVRGLVPIHGYLYGVGNSLTNVSGTLFFANGDALHGFELWKSDGTPGGTQMVKDIRFGADGSFPRELTNVDGTLFFRARGPDGAAELWKSDGTESGTVIVVDLPNTSAYLPGSYPIHLTNIGGTLYFQTADGVRYKSDGTEEGTVQTEVQSSTATDVSGEVYYLRHNPDGSSALRKIDQQGTTKGLKTFREVSNLTNVAGTLFFAARQTAVETFSLWKSDGTSVGTVRVGPANGNVDNLINVGGQLFFTAVDAGGRELWKSNGTTAGTVRIRDIMPGELNSSLADFRNVAGILYFSASNGVTGNELWRSNGTSAGTFVVKDLVPGAAGAHPEDLAGTDSGQLFFTASTTAFGREPYVLLPQANTAPVLDLGHQYSLTDMEEDRPFAHVTFVRSLLGTGQTDADASALKGIAIVDADVRYGRWQYRGPTDSVWHDLGSPSEDNARLLAADQDTKIRFLPNLNFNGATHFSFRAWDRTEGVAGQLYTTAGHTGGSTAFSTAVGSAEIVVHEVNDAPVLNTALNPKLKAVARTDANPSGSPLNALMNNAISDVDAQSQQGIAVIGAGPAAAGVWQFSFDGGESWNDLGAVSSTNARLLPVFAWIRLVPNASFTGQARLSYRAWDQTAGSHAPTYDPTGQIGGVFAFSTAIESATINVTPVNDAPVVSLGATIGYVHDDPPVALAPSATVEDVDGFGPGGAVLTLQITDGASNSNRLAIGVGFTVDDLNNVRQGETIIGQRTSNGFATNPLTIAFSASATPAIAQQLLRAITFKTVAGAAGPRRILLTLADGDGGESEATKLVNVS